MYNQFLQVTILKQVYTLKITLFSLLVNFVKVLYYLPHWWRKVFSSLYFQSRGFHHVSESCVEAMIQFCHPTVFYNVRSLVWNELEAITQLDTEVGSESVLPSLSSVQLQFSTGVREMEGQIQWHIQDFNCGWGGGGSGCISGSLE